jgi:hypothetical protein
MMYPFARTPLPLWNSWLEGPGPPAILYITDHDALICVDKASEVRLLRKRVANIGLDTQVWAMSGTDYGSALIQDRLMVVMTLGVPTVPAKPQGGGLTARGMANLLLPTGIRKAEWSRRDSTPFRTLEKAKSAWPWIIRPTRAYAGFWWSVGEC